MSPVERNWLASVVGRANRLLRRWGVGGRIFVTKERVRRWKNIRDYHFWGSGKWLQPVRVIVYGDGVYCREIGAYCEGEIRTAWNSFNALSGSSIFARIGSQDCFVDGSHSPLEHPIYLFLAMNALVAYLRHYTKQFRFSSLWGDLTRNKISVTVRLGDRKLELAVLGGTGQAKLTLGREVLCEGDMNEVIRRLVGLSAIARL